MAHDDIPPDLAAYGSRKEPKLSAEDVARYIPRWSYWVNLAVVDVMDAVYLSLSIDPKAARDNQGVAKNLPGVKERLDIAVSNMAARSLPSYLTEADHYHGLTSGTAVKLQEFRAWGESLPSPFGFPDEFPRVAVPVAPVAMAAPEGTLRSRERNNLLRIIRALDAMNPRPLPQTGYAESIRAKLDELGLTAVSDDTIRKAVEEARKLDS